MLDDLDPFVPATAVRQALGGVSRRTLYNMVLRDDFPPPDRKAKRRGERDLWRKSTVREGLAAYASAPASVAE